MFRHPARLVVPALFLVAAPSAHAWDCAHIDERWAAFQLGGAGSLTLKAWERDGGPELKLVLKDFILQIQWEEGCLAVGALGPEGESWKVLPFDSNLERDYAILIQGHLSRAWDQAGFREGYWKFLAFLNDALHPGKQDASLENLKSKGDLEREMALRTLLKDDLFGMGLGSVTSLGTFFETFRKAGPSGFKVSYLGENEVRDVELWQYLEWKRNGAPALHGTHQRFARFATTRRTLPSGFLSLYGHRQAAGASGTSSSSSSSSSASSAGPSGLSDGSGFAGATGSSLPTGNLVSPVASGPAAGSPGRAMESKADGKALEAAPSTPVKAYVPHWPPYADNPMFRGLSTPSPLRGGGSPGGGWQIGDRVVSPIRQPIFGDLAPATPPESPDSLERMRQIAQEALQFDLSSAEQGPRALPSPDTVLGLPAPDQAGTALAQVPEPGTLLVLQAEASHGAAELQWPAPPPMPLQDPPTGAGQAPVPAQ